MPRSIASRLVLHLALLAVFLAPAHAADRSARPALFKSTDRGRSWSRSDDGLPGDSRINALGSLDNALFAGTDAGIFISRDEGRNWRAAAGAATNSGRILCFASLGRNLYAGTDRGRLLLSSKNGEAWSVKATLPAGMIRCLLGHQGRLYAGGDAGGVQVSADLGDAWTHLDRGLPEHAQVFTMSMVNGSLFAALYGKGLYRWNEQDHRWTKVGHVSPLVMATVDGTLIVGHNPGGLHWTDDLGASWFPGTSDATGFVTSPLGVGSGELSTNAPVWELASGDGIVVAGVADGIYYSEDRGRTWVRARQGLPSESPGVSFLVKGNLVLAGSLIP